MVLCFTSVTGNRMVFSLYALELGATPSSIGLLLASFFVFPLLISWTVGRWGDRVGARRPLVLANAVCGVALTVPFAIGKLPALYAAAVMMGFAFACYNVLLQNLVGLMSTRETRARNFSNSSMVASVTAFIGPPLGGLAIDHLAGNTACVVFAGLPMIAIVLLLIYGRALPGGRSTAAPPSRVRDSLQDTGTLRLLATGALIQLGQDLFQFYLPVYGHSKGLSGFTIGVALASFAAAAFIVRFAMRVLLERWGEHRLIRYSVYVSALALVGLPFVASGPAVAAVAFVFGLGMGCGLPVTTMMMFSYAAEGRSGEALGLRQTVNNAARVSGPIVFGMIGSAFGLPLIFWTSAVMMAGGGLVTRVDDSTRKPTGDD